MVKKTKTRKSTGGACRTPSTNIFPSRRRRSWSCSFSRRHRFLSCLSEFEHHGQAGSPGAAYLCGETCASVDHPAGRCCNVDALLGLTVRVQKLHAAGALRTKRPVFTNANRRDDSGLFSSPERWAP